MADVITRLKVESSEYDSKIKRATQSLNEMTTAAEREGKKIATANKENIAMAQSLGKMQTVATSARGKMGELSSAIESATLMYNRLSAAEKQGQFGKALNASITQLKGRLKDLQGEMAAVNKQMGSLNKGGGLGGIIGKGGGLSGMMGSFGGGMGSAVSSLGPYAIGAAAAAAAIGGLKKAVGDYLSINREFEQANANLAAVLGKTRGEIALLTEDAKKYGASTMFTASQVTELQTNLAKLGFTMGEIKNSTKAVLDLSAATGYDLASSASIAGAALRSFGLDATEMDRVTSVLGVSTSKSALDMEKLSVAMPIVGSAAAAMGFSIEDTVALLGKLVDTGMDASTAATALRNIFLKLADPSSKMSQAIGGNIRSLDDLVPALQKCKDEGMDLGEMFEIAKERGTVAFNTLVNGAEDVKKLRDELVDCDDAMRQMVDTQMNTLEGATKQLDSAWEGLMLSFKSSNGILAETKRALADLLSAWTRWNNRAAGGEAAISTYSRDMTDTERQMVMDKVNTKLAGGSRAKDLVSGAEKMKAAYEKTEQKWVELQKRFDQASFSERRGLESEIASTFGMSVNGMDYRTMSNAMAQKIADKRRQIAGQEYIIEYAGSKIEQPKTEDPNEDSGLSEKERKKREKEQKAREAAARRAAAQQQKDANNAVKLQKAQYEEEEKAQIAALDQMAMSQEEYEQKFYDIKHNTLEKIAGLYKNETVEKADANARIYDLEIQHNQKIAAAARKAAEQKAKAEEEYRKKTGIGNYSSEGLAARLKFAKSSQESAAIGSGEYLYQADRIVDLTSFSNLLKTATEAGIQLDPEQISGLLDQIDMDVNIPDQVWEILTDQINEQLKNLGLDPIVLDVQTGGVEAAQQGARSTADAWNNAVAAVNNVGDALQQIEDPAAKVSGIVMQAVANIALGFAQAAASPATGAAGVFGWIAAATAGVATMASTIAAIKSATSGSYASGGIIPGNSYSGDNLIANVNAGELILNRAQQASVAAQLRDSNPMSNMRLSTEISGQNLRIVLNNDNRARGGSRTFYSELH